MAALLKCGAHSTHDVFARVMIRDHKLRIIVLVK